MQFVSLPLDKNALDNAAAPEIAVVSISNGFTKEIIYAGNPTHGHVHRE
jgi:hypothetical protein